jgi:hypothetical protein
MSGPRSRPTWRRSPTSRSRLRPCSRRWACSTRWSTSTIHHLRGGLLRPHHHPSRAQARRRTGPLGRRRPIPQGRRPRARHHLTTEVVVNRAQPQRTRDRAIWIVRLATFGGVAGALGLTWLFSDLAQAYFSGQAATPKAGVPPKLPLEAVPVQKAPTVVQTVVHHPYQGGSTAPAPAGTAPRPPAQAPAAAPPPPPAPVCHSTPSKPC